MSTTTTTCEPIDRKRVNNDNGGAISGKLRVDWEVNKQISENSRAQNNGDLQR